MRGPLDPAGLRQRVADARVLLVFTPELCAGRDPLATLAALAPYVDVVQVRPKPLGAAGGPADRTEARAARDWTLRALDALERAGHPELPVVVNDRVDVARALAGRGAAGVHVGDRDTPAAVAREVLGPDALIGLSTHTLEQVVAAGEEPVDLVGFGPVFATATKGYGAAAPGAAATGPAPSAAFSAAPRLVGPERAWIASEASAVPLFAIGGIDLTNVDELAEVGRVAVGSALLAAADPARAARELRAALT